MADATALFVGFKDEHRKIRDTVNSLVGALREGDAAQARELLRELDGLAGPHFRYEEETMYPALRPWFPAGYIDSKLADHDGAIATGLP